MWLGGEVRPFFVRPFFVRPSVWLPDGGQAIGNVCPSVRPSDRPYGCQTVVRQLVMSVRPSVGPAARLPDGGQAIGNVCPSVRRTVRTAARRWSGNW